MTNKSMLFKKKTVGQKKIIYLNVKIRKDFFSIFLCSFKFFLLIFQILCYVWSLELRLRNRVK